MQNIKVPRVVDPMFPQIAKEVALNFWQTTELGFLALGLSVYAAVGSDDTWNRFETPFFAQLIYQQTIPELITRV